MILLLALAGGLPVGMASSRWRGQTYQAPELQAAWLVFLAFLPQFVALYLPPVKTGMSDWLSACCLIVSMLAFLVFAWLNHKVTGMSLLIIGLVLNLLVIISNGGFMPINPTTASHLLSKETLLDFQIGERIGTKDILLSKGGTHFEFLADRFLTPTWFPYHVAFSLGDVFIALGAFVILAWPGLSIKKE